MEKKPFAEFGGLEYDASQLRLQRALEGVFSISSHILSRIPGGQASKYSEIALNLGKYKIVDRDFAENTLVKMAKYRNRLVHFYDEITPKEIYDIIQNHLGDFDIFLAAIKKVLEHPENFDLSIE